MIILENYGYEKILDDKYQNIKLEKYQKIIFNTKNISIKNSNEKIFLTISKSILSNEDIEKVNYKMYINDEIDKSKDKIEIKIELEKLNKKKLKRIEKILLLNWENIYKEYNNI